MPRKMNRYSLLRATATVVGLVALCSLSLAQDNGGRSRGMRGFGGGGGRDGAYFMLRRNDVQSDLHLSSDQKTKLQDLFDSMRGQRGGGRNRDNGSGNGGGSNGGRINTESDADRQARRAQMEAQRKEMQTKIDAILTSSQEKRLKEISIQTRGSMAVLDDNVQKDLGLTSEQRTKIKSLRDKMQEANQSIFEKMRDNSLSRDDAFQSMQKNNDVMKTELAKVLTESQRSKLKDMGGAPFKADPSEQNFGGFGRGGRRGGGGGNGG